MIIKQARFGGCLRNEWINFSTRFSFWIANNVLVDRPVAPSITEDGRVFTRPVVNDLTADIKLRPRFTARDNAPFSAIFGGSRHKCRHFYLRTESMRARRNPGRGIRCQQRASGERLSPSCMVLCVAVFVPGGVLRFRNSESGHAEGIIGRRRRCIFARPNGRPSVPQCPALAIKLRHPAPRNIHSEIPLRNPNRIHIRMFKTDKTLVYLRVGIGLPHWGRSERNRIQC